MKIPKNWNKIPLQNFVHYTEYLEEEAETLADKINLLKKKTCAILGCDLEEAGNLTAEQQKQLGRLLTTPLPRRLMLKFKHKGVTYRPFINVSSQKNPLKVIELTNEMRGIDLDTDKFNGGKYSAFKNVAKRGHKEQGLNDNLPHLLYLLCEPITFGLKKQFPFVGWKPKKQTPQSIEQGIKDFKTLPLEISNPLTVFFLTLSRQLSDLFADFSVREIEKMTVQMKQLQASLEKDMDTPL